MRNLYPQKNRSAVVVVLMSLAMATFSTRAESSAKDDYLANCARCHGADGKGDAPRMRAVPGYESVDLTVLAEQNGGIFPRQKVFDSIKGSKRFPAHFVGDMPTWGLEFQDNPNDPEKHEAVQARVSELVDYIESIQNVTTEPSGEQEYKASCARCHGNDGKGDGPDANEKPGYHPADLTRIALRDGGTFSWQTVYETIDGAKRLPGHYDFNSPMPLWGLGFQPKGKEYSAESEARVIRRINALVDYLGSIQQ